MHSHLVRRVPSRFSLKTTSQGGLFQSSSHKRDVLEVGKPDGVGARSLLLAHSYEHSNSIHARR